MVPVVQQAFGWGTAFHCLPFSALQTSRGSRPREGEELAHKPGIYQCALPPVWSFQLVLLWNVWSLWGHGQWCWWLTVMGVRGYTRLHLSSGSIGDESWTWWWDNDETVHRFGAIDEVNGWQSMTTEPCTILMLWFKSPRPDSTFADIVLWRWIWLCETTSQLTLFKASEAEHKLRTCGAEMKTVYMVQFSLLGEISRGVQAKKGRGRMKE